MTTHLERLMTVADIEAIPEDGNLYEVIGGVIFMSCAPTITHQRVLLNLIADFLLYLARNPVGELLPGPGVIFDQYNAVIPDLVFVSNAQRTKLIGQERLYWAPDLVTEILSPGAENERRDLEIKRRCTLRLESDNTGSSIPRIRRRESYAETMAVSKPQFSTPAMR